MDITHNLRQKLCAYAGFLILFKLVSYMYRKMDF